MIGVTISALLGAVMGNWPMWGGEPTHQSVQLMKGAITSPVIKWGFNNGFDGTFVYKFSAMADVDGDGAMEVVTADFHEHTVYCLTGSDGTQKWAFVTAGNVESSPSVADVDGDGYMEVVVGSHDYNVYCLAGSDGAQKWKFRTNSDVESSPAIADVDGDDQTEVVIGSYDRKVYCLAGSNGAQKWAFTTGNLVNSSPAVADVNGDGQTEVVIGSWDGKVYCLSGSDGNQKWGFATGGAVQSSPAIADVDGDGAMEVVVGSFDDTVRCLAGSDGAQKWAFTTGGWVFYPGALVDIDGDDKLEYLVSQRNTSILHCLNAENGTLAWQIDLDPSSGVYGLFAGDIDGDACSEIIVVAGGTGSSVIAIDDPGNAQDCGSVDVDESLGRGFDFRATGRNIYLFTPKSAQVSLAIYDAGGRLVQRLYDGVLSQGGHTFRPNLEARGVYLALLRYQGGMKALKLVR